MGNGEDPFQRVSKKTLFRFWNIDTSFKKIRGYEAWVNIKALLGMEDRMVIVELTEKAMDLKKEIVEVPDQMYCKLDGFDKDEMLQLKKSLDKMLKKLGR